MELTSEQREGLIELLAMRYLDSMDLKGLETFFLDTTEESLSSYSDAELVEGVEDMTSEEEFQELMKEIVCA